MSSGVSLSDLQDARHAEQKAPQRLQIRQALSYSKKKKAAMQPAIDNLIQSVPRYDMLIEGRRETEKRRRIKRVTSIS
jgi:hypothetical protein